MNLDDLVPQGGGSLRAPAAPPVREPVARFSVPDVVHPDELWGPGVRGSELAPPQRPLTQPVQFYQHAGERLVRASHTDALSPHAEAAAQIRAAIRPGV
jgi:hypothetical protein